jgi:hypothetical protein
MGRIDNLLFILNSLTGRRVRHNRALRDVTEWSSTVQELLTEYNLHEEGSNLSPVLENVGKVQFELTSITHKARGIIQIAHNIKGAKVSPLVIEITDELESVRRALIKPALSTPNLIKALTELRSSLLKLNGAISGIEYK